MRELFKEFNFRQSSLDVISQANDIIEEYLADGYDLTLRQLYYQFVARDLIPNNQKSYKRIGGIINDARLAGMVDWATIKDRTRSLRKYAHETGPAEAIESWANSYGINTRLGQDTYCEVWVEKEALAGVIGRAANKHDVPYFACKGYVSQSAMYEAAMRCNRQDSKSIRIIHLGDHDPSGMDMTRDIEDRLELFGCFATVDRIALNMAQVEEYNPPYNPAKITDSRASAYISEYGSKSWELDALDPKTLAKLIDDAIESVTDADQYALMVERESKERDSLKYVSSVWEDIQQMIGDGVL